MFQKKRRKHALLKKSLLRERQMMSLMEKEMAVSTGDLVEDRENWVRMWIDQGHVVLSDNDQVKAYRGIDFDGNLMWMVRHPRKKFGYHSTHTDPFEAIEEARSAWRERGRVRTRWPLVKQIAWDLALGRKSFYVSREDAYRSALCSAGTDAFMARIGCRNRKGLSGRAAAFCMLFEKQLGFVIYAAYERHQCETAQVQNKPTADLQTNRA